MDQTKAALTTLEQAVLKLESAIYAAKKTQAQLAEQVSELRQAVQTTYDKLDQMIDSCRKDEE